MRHIVEIDTEVLVALRKYAPGWEGASAEWQDILTRADEALRIANLPKFEIHGRLWWGRESYPLFTVRMYEDGKLIWQGRGTGSGSMYLQVAVAWLKKQGKVPEDAEGTTLYVRETLHSDYSLEEVQLKKHLHDTKDGVPLDTGL